MRRQSSLNQLQFICTVVLWSEVYGTRPKFSVQVTGIPDKSGSRMHDRLAKLLVRDFW